MSVIMALISTLYAFSLVIPERMRDAEVTHNHFVFAL
jgi:hypothetical protein